MVNPVLSAQTLTPRSSISYKQLPHTTNPSRAPPSIIRRHQLQLTHLTSLRSRRTRSHIQIIITLITIFAITLIVRTPINIFNHQYPNSNHNDGAIRVPSSHRQRVVILAGPHKTGTTSLQNNIMFWTSHQDPDNTLSKNWIWPVPEQIIQYESKDRNNWKWNHAKGFYALMEALRDWTKYEVTDRMVFQRMSKERVITAYAQEFTRAWMTGKNIVIGSEALDFVVKDDDGGRILEQLLSIMPWNYHKIGVNGLDDLDSSVNSGNRIIINGTDDNLTMVVTYRTPRVDHLISIWREWNQKRKMTDRNTFYQWILRTSNTFGAIDSLRMVELFRKRGLKVLVLDGEGIKVAGFDSSGVVSCNVLGARCTTNKVVVGLEGKKVTKNVKVGKGDVNLTEVQRDKIDYVMKIYDCNFYHLLQDRKVTFLYPKAIYKNLEMCGDNDGANNNNIMISRAGMKSDVLKIVLNENFTL